MKYVNRLAPTDIIELLQFSFVYDFEECKSSDQETRAFRMPMGTEQCLWGRQTVSKSI